MINRLYRWALLGLALFLLGTDTTNGVVTAQDDSVQIVVYGGNPRIWDGNSPSLKPLSNIGYQLEPVLSPDGTRIANAVYPQITIDAIDSPYGDIHLTTAFPSDIWLTELRTGNSLQLAHQPTGASYHVRNHPDVAIVRSKPAWSPTSTQLAWIEYSLPTKPAQGRIIVYDFVKASQATWLDNVPLPDSGTVPELLWTSNRLIVRVIPYQGPSQFLVYDLQGNLQKIVQFVDTETEDPISYFPITFADQTFIARVYPDGRWEILDMASGQTRNLWAQPEIFSPNAPDGFTGAIYVGKPDLFVVQLYDSARKPVGSLLNLPNTYMYTSPLSKFAFSPDGQSAVYITMDKVEVRGELESHLTLWRNSETREFPNPDVAPYVLALVWGPTAWRISEDPVATCPAKLPLNVIVGKKAKLSAKVDSAEVRSDPALTAPIIGSIPAEETLKVTAGPACHDGMRWWLIDYGSVTGWAAEGSDEIRYFEKFTG